jgi:hypothetical protein
MGEQSGGSVEIRRRTEPEVISWREVEIEAGLIGKKQFL